MLEVEEVAVTDGHDHRSVDFTQSLADRKLELLELDLGFQPQAKGVRLHVGDECPDFRVVAAPVDTCAEVQLDRVVEAPLVKGGFFRLPQDSAAGRSYLPLRASAIPAWTSTIALR